MSRCPDGIYAVDGDLDHLLWVKNGMVENGSYPVVPAKGRTGAVTMVGDEENPSFVAVFVLDVPPGGDRHYNSVLERARRILKQRQLVEADVRQAVVGDLLPLPRPQGQILTLHLADGRRIDTFIKAICAPEEIDTLKVVRVELSPPRDLPPGCTFSKLP